MPSGPVRFFCVYTQPVPESASQPEPANQAIFQATIDHYLAPIKTYLDDAGVAEVMVNRFDEVYIEKDGKLVKTDARFPDPDAYDAAVHNILQFTGKIADERTPLIDARLPNGSRVHVAREPVARHGTVMTIRKFSQAVLDIDWLVHLGALSAAGRDYLQLAIRSERNMLVSGGTSTGKTSLLNALSVFIPEGQRIVLIEDSAEMQIQQPHVVSMEAKAADRYGEGGVSIRDLFRSSLRLRPDRIIIGEVRGGEALDMIQAMTSGHGGSMGTLHADSPYDTLNRLETLALMSKVELPLHALRSQIASAIDLVVQMTRQVGGERRVTQISEVLPLGDDGHYRLQNVFDMKPDDQGQMQLTWTGVRSAFADLLRDDDRAHVTPTIEPIFA